MKTKLIIFDMDGVLFEGESFWLDLHRKFGTVSTGVKLAKKYLNSNYDLLVEHVAGRLWKGKDASIYKQLIALRQYQPGVKKVFDFIHQHGTQSAIISTGPYDLAKRAQNELGIDEIRANRLVVKGGKIVGSVEVMVKESEKANIGLELVNEMNVDLPRVAFVGDSDSDVELAIQVGLPIAYNSKSKQLRKVCKYVLGHGNLPSLISILQSN